MATDVRVAHLRGRTVDGGFERRSGSRNPQTTTWSGFRVSLVLLALIALAGTACAGPGASPTVTGTGTPTATEPLGTAPTATEPAETEPAETEPAETEPTGTEPTGTEPTGTAPTGVAGQTCQTASEDVTTEPAGVEAPATAVSLDFWNPFTGPDGAYMQALVDRFNTEAENVQVTNTTQSEYYTQIANAQQSGTLPDIMVMHLDQVALHAANGFIAPMDTAVLGVSAEDFTEPVWQGTFWQEQQYSVPLDIHPAVLYYNTQYVPDAPTDQASFEAALQGLQDQGITGPVWSNHFFSAGLFWASLFYQGGGEWTNADYTEVTFDSEAGVQATTYMRGLIDQGLHPAEAAPDDEVSGFEGGTSGMAITGIWQTCRFANALGESFAVAPVPSILGDGNWAGSHTLATRADISGDEQAGALYFIDWITRNAAVWAAGGQVPARSSVREGPAFQGLDYVSDLAPAAENAQFPPPIPGSADFLGGPGGANETVVGILASGGDAQQLLTQSADTFTQILLENKETYGF